MKPALDGTNASYGHFPATRVAAHITTHTHTGMQVGRLASEKPGTLEDRRLLAKDGLTLLTLNAVTAQQQRCLLCLRN